MIRWTGEAEAGTPYWWAGIDWPRLDAPPPPATDLLVIGGGYTGLSAAIAAHDAGAKVAVIDAGQPGQGASTRNGGMFGAHPRLPWPLLAQHFGEEAADAVFAEAATALDWAEALIRREGIDCGYQRTGRIQLAWTGAHFAAQQRLATDVNTRSRVTCEVVPRNRLADEIATPLYKGGILFPEHGGLDPARYHRGLLAAVLGRGIPVSGYCPALRHERPAGGHLVVTPRGSVRAGKVVLATNGYTGKPFGRMARRVFPLPSFLIATEPLSDNLIGRLAPGRRMMVETRARYSYYRISPDGTRILFGGRAAMVNIGLPRAAARLRETMLGIWPELEDARLSHVWSGNTGYSFAHVPHVGEADGMHYALAFSGSGNVLAPYLGAKAALRALGDPGGETAYARTRLGTRWFYPGGAPWFLVGADLWYRHVVDRRDNRAARR